MMNTQLRLAGALLLASLLGACGGGGGGASFATLPLLPGDTGTPAAPALPAQPTGADPNAIVTTPTRTLDLRWGARASPHVLATTDNVRRASSRRPATSRSRGCIAPNRSPCPSGWTLRCRWTRAAR